MEVRSGPRRLTAERLAARAGTTVVALESMARAGILQPGPDGRFAPGDVHRIRIALAFERSGVPLDVLSEAIRAGTVSFDYYDDLHPDPGDLSERTWEQLLSDLGSRAALLDRLVTTLGLARPAADDRLARDDEAALLGLLEIVTAIDRTDLALRAARLLGDGARQTSDAALDIYRLAVDDVNTIARGLPNQEIYDRFLEPWSRFARLVPTLAAWLHERHLSGAIDAYSIDATESVLEEHGFVPERPTSPPAVAFVDLSGFTSWSVERGDEAAASVAMQLADLAEDAVRRHGGRVVKLLGDGVLLRFDSPPQAVEAAFEILDGLVDAALPSGHAGIHAGPFVVREGDIFGRTVNLASRLADRAGPGQLLVSDAVAVELPRERFICEAGVPVALQGFADPVVPVLVTRA